MKKFTVNPETMEATVKFIQSFTAGKCSPKRKGGVCYLSGGKKVIAFVLNGKGNDRINMSGRYYLKKEEIWSFVEEFLTDGKSFSMKTGPNDRPLRVSFALKDGSKTTSSSFAVRIKSEVIFGKTKDEVKAGDVCPCCGGKKTAGTSSCISCFELLRNGLDSRVVSSKLDKIETVLQTIADAEKQSREDNPEKETLLPATLVNIKINKKAIWKEEEKYYRSILIVNGGYIAVYIKGLPAGMEGKTVTCLATGKYNGKTPYIRAQFVPDVRADMKFVIRDKDSTEGMNPRLPAWEVDESFEVLVDGDVAVEKGLHFTIGFRKG